MIITILKPFGPYSRGQVLPDVPGGQARDWIARGLALEGECAPFPMAAPYHRAQPAGPISRMMKGKGKR
ncbi:MAG: hypothetical protein J0H82_25990 [Alphaproteobacteria bacterium]|nr:hypothetical protein [Alphaproteobacteria bacterium]